MSEAGKLQIDDDWKSQADAEKKRLSEELDKRKAAPSPASGAPTAAAKAPQAAPAPQGAEAEDAAPGADAGPDEYPEATFGGLVSDLAIQTLAALGLLADPETGKPLPANLPAAKFNIDLLGVLHAKTRGNLDTVEREGLEQALYQLRLHYVQAAGRQGA